MHYFLVYDDMEVIYFGETCLRVVFMRFICLCLTKNPCSWSIEMNLQAHKNIQSYISGALNLCEIRLLKGVALSISVQSTLFRAFKSWDWIGSS